MLKKMLVCLDGSKLADQILPFAVEEAVCCGGNLILLRLFGFDHDLVEPYGIQSIRIIKEDEAKAYLESKALHLREAGIDVECTVIQSGPESKKEIGQRIVRYAADHGIDLIALATHGNGGLKRIAFGSVPGFILRNIDLPILLIRPKKLPTHQTREYDAAFTAQSS